MTEHLARPDWMSPSPRYTRPQRHGLRGPRRGRAPRHPRRRAAQPLRLDARARVGLHQRPAAPAGRPAGLRQALERGAGARRPAGGPRRELAVLLRPRAVARDPDRAVRAVHRHPAAGAEEPGRAARGCGSGSAGSPRSSTCSRRTSATSRRCCRRSATRTRSPSSRPARPPRLQELRLHNGTIYRWNRPVYDVVDGPRTCGWRTGCCRPARPSSTCSRTPPSTTAPCGCSPTTSGRSGRR